jgi:hypothetical protein
VNTANPALKNPQQTANLSLSRLQPASQTNKAFLTCISTSSFYDVTEYPRVFKSFQLQHFLLPSLSPNPPKFILGFNLVRHGMTDDPSSRPSKASFKKSNDYNHNPHYCGFGSSSACLNEDATLPTASFQLLSLSQTAIFSCIIAASIDPG